MLDIDLLLIALDAATPDGVGAVSGHGVPLVYIDLPDPLYRDGNDGFAILLTVGHNVDGWEACIDTDGDQYGLPDGPGEDASVAEIVAWIAPLVQSAVAAAPAERDTAEAWADSTFGATL